MIMDSSKVVLNKYSLSVTIFFPKDMHYGAGFLAIPLIPAKAASPNEAVANLARNLAGLGPRWFEEFGRNTYWVIDSEFLKQCLIKVTVAQDFTKDDENV